MADLITCKKSSSMVELDCKFTFKNGQTFESGGSYLVPDKNGLLRGILYAYPEENKIGTWDGTLKLDAEYMQTYESAFRAIDGFNQKNQVIRFEYNGKKFSGIWYNKEWSGIVRVKELKE